MTTPKPPPHLTVRNLQLRKAERFSKGLKGSALDNILKELRSAECAEVCAKCTVSSPSFNSHNTSIESAADIATL